MRFAPIVLILITLCFCSGDKQKTGDSKHEIQDHSDTTAMECRLTGTAWYAFDSDDYTELRNGLIAECERSYRDDEYYGRVRWAISEWTHSGVAQAFFSKICEDYRDADVLLSYELGSIFEGGYACKVILAVGDEACLVQSNYAHKAENLSYWTSRIPRNQLDRVLDELDHTLNLFNQESHLTSEEYDERVCVLICHFHGKSVGLLLHGIRQDAVSGLEEAVLVIDSLFPHDW